MPKAPRLNPLYRIERVDEFTPEQKRNREIRQYAKEYVLERLIAVERDFESIEPLSFARRFAEYTDEIDKSYPID